MFSRIKHVHFVGVGGVGMSGIAEVLLNMGYTVTGSDVRQTPVTEMLDRRGATVFASHAAEHIGGAHVVIVSSAVKPANPEIVEAKRRKIPIISRAEMLAELMRLKYSIAVAGTHGKTTTTSMVAMILDRAGFDPTFVVGGRLNTVGSGARLGKGEFIVLEADESDRSFLLLSPTLAVITNIEADHLDHYRDLDDIQNAFVSFVNRVPFYGTAVVCLDDSAARSIIPRIKRRVVTFGSSPHANVSIRNHRMEAQGSTFLLRFGSDTQKCGIQVPGFHNILNATAAFALGCDMGIDAGVMASALESFRGVERRFQVKLRDRITVIDDYAHHPTEVRATLDAAKLGGFKRILVAFQPHRYTRIERLMNDFAKAFDCADMVLVADIYPAGEAPIRGVTAEALVETMKRFGHRSVFHTPSLELMESRLVENARDGDAIVIMGAGSIAGLADTLAEKMKNPLPTGGRSATG